MVVSTVPRLYETIQSAERLTYQYLSLWQRVRLILIELCIGALFIAIIVTYLVQRPALVAYIFSSIEQFAAPSAYAQAGASAAPAVRDIIFALLGGSIVVTILMSAYAALFKQPPSSAGKEILKYTLAFAIGVLATFLGAK
jgi:hypothetical protein